MNLYTHLLFLHGYITDPALVGDYGAQFGNRRANRRALREIWEPGTLPAKAANDEPAPEPGTEEPQRACG